MDVFVSSLFMFVEFHFRQDIFGKFDGYLSPSQDLKFADVPSGLAAISKVPLEGWLQVLLVAGLIETQLFKERMELAK